MATAITAGAALSAASLPMQESLGFADKSFGMSDIANSSDPCPIDIDETAEAHAMKRLSAADALHFAVHCTRCIPCAAAARKAARFVSAMKAAAQELMANPSTTGG